MPTHQFNIVQTDTKSTGCSINCDFDVFSANRSLICNYVKKLRGIMVDLNTARFPSYEAVEELFHKLYDLIKPIKKHSKKR